MDGTKAGSGAPEQTTTGSLLEREEELRSLDRLLQAAAHHEAGLVLIEGRAGIGKSALLAELRSRAPGEGLRVLAARGGELEREFAFGVVRQLFEPLLADPAEADRLLEGAAAAARAVFDPTAETRDDDSGVFAALHGLYWLALNIAADKPLLLSIDDLHWVDSASLQFIAYLVRRLEGQPVLVASTLRSAEPGADPALLAELGDDPGTVAIHPGPLSEPAVIELVKAKLGESADPAFCDACLEATKGNPLLLRQLLQALEADSVEPKAANAEVVRDIGPRAVSRSVQVRLGRLPGEAATVAQAVAVLGESADIGTVAALAELDEETVAQATGALAQGEILDRGTPIAFVHPLVRDAVYDELPAGERELKHTRAAELLNEDPGAGPDEVATHLLQMPRAGQEWVVRTLRNAARSAVSKGAADSAAAYLRRALEEPPDPEIANQTLLELGIIEALTDAPAAIAHLREALGGISDPLAKGLTANLLARVLLFTGSEDEAAEIAERVAEDLPIELEDVSLSLYAFVAASTGFGVDRPEALERLKAFRNPKRVHQLGEKMMAAAAAYDWAHRNGPRDEVIALAKAALEGGDVIEADNGLLPMYAIAGLMLADTDEVQDAWEQMLAIAHSRGSLFGITTILLWKGYSDWRRGDLAEAEQQLRTAIDSFKIYGYGEGVTTYVASHLGSVMLDRGDVKQAREVFSLVRDPGPGLDVGRYWLNTEMALLLDEQRFEELVAAADEFSRRFTWITNPTDAHWRSMKALGLDGLGKTDEAIALTEEELVLGREWGAPRTVGRILRVLGTLKRDDGIDDLRESVGVLEESTARLEHAKALAALGSGLRRARKPSDAREPLRQALEIADVCGAERVVAEIRSELHAAGARPRRTALSGVESLTASEKRVADMAASGETNRDIAQALYVTPKTVEVHLTNCYRKLEIRSRRELPTVLAPS
jgi:DNA-binding CsgD family transcriptional regulator